VTHTLASEYEPARTRPYRPTPTPYLRPRFATTRRFVSSSHFRRFAVSRHADVRRVMHDNADLLVGGDGPRWLSRTDRIMRPTPR